MLNLILGFVMFGVAMGITTDDLKGVLRSPKVVGVGLVGQLLLLPAVTLLLVALLSPWLTPGVAMGMILVSCCPGGNVSNFMVHLAKGKDRILGATIVATHAGEMISEVTLAMVGKLGLGTILNVIHPYPTQAEALKRVAGEHARRRLTPTVAKLFERIMAWSR